MALGGFGAAGIDKVRVALGGMGGQVTSLRNSRAFAQNAKGQAIRGVHRMISAVWDVYEILHG